MPANRKPKLFKYRHFEPEIILLCLRWYLRYLRYALSYRDLEEMMTERSLCVDHTTIYRWVQRYAPILEKKCRVRLKPTNDSWRVDETYVKVKGQWMYLYRAVDSAGNWCNSGVYAQSCQEHTGSKALLPQGSACQAYHTFILPRVINVDRNPSYPKAVGKLKRKGTLPQNCELRPIKVALIKFPYYLVEQDHRLETVKLPQLEGQPGNGFRVVRHGMEDTARYEVRGNKPVTQRASTGTARGDILSQVRFVEQAFGLAA